MKNEKISKRKLQAEETKKKIFDSAYKLFDQYGFDNVSIDSIVELAGVAKGSFYVHFESKYSIISNIIIDYVKRMDTSYKLFLESLPSDMKISEILILFAGYIADNISTTIGYTHMKILYEANLTKALNTESTLGDNRELYKLYNNLILQGIKQEEFRTDFPVETISKHLVMCIRGLTYEWLIRYPDFDLKDNVIKHYEILLTGIKK